MSITDELREYVQDWRDTPSLMDGLDRGDVDGILEDFIRIADRIDERHRKALEKVAAMVDEEVVLCGDCRWRKGVVCGYFDKITWVMDFCSHGTRRDA